MALVTGSRTLVIGVLQAARAHHRFEGENLPGGFPNHLVGTVRPDAGIPERFPLGRDQDGIAQLQANHRVELRQPES